MKAKEIVLLINGMMLLCMIDCKNAGVVCCTCSWKHCSVYLFQ